MAKKNPAERAKALMAGLAPRQLVSALLVLEHKDVRSEEEKLTRAWLCEELERRYPQVIPALDAWADDVDGAMGELSYGEVLIAHLPPAAVAA